MSGILEQECEEVSLFFGDSDDNPENTEAVLLMRQAEERI